MFYSKILVLAALSLVLFLVISCDKNVEEEISGVYSGTASSNLFPGPYSVTFDLNEVDGTVSGSYYLSATDSAHFGGADDGSFRAELIGTTLKNIKVIQDLERIQCPGVFEGSGTIDIRTGRISISWTGTDCSGFHDGGIFTLAKI